MDWIGVAEAGTGGESRTDSSRIQVGLGSIWPSSSKACRASGHLCRVRPGPTASKSVVQPCVMQPLALVRQCRLPASGINRSAR